MQIPLNLLTKKGDCYITERSDLEGNGVPFLKMYHVGPHILYFGHREDYEGDTQFWYYRTSPWATEQVSLTIFND